MIVNKVLTWVLIVALLLGQSYAYASVPCESVDDLGSQHTNHMASMSTDEMQHQMPQQALAMDCCDQDCSCPTGTCSSVTLSHFMIVTAVNIVSQPSVFYLFSIQDAFLPSLRKPPIIG
ncbi:hypothetical protein [uncultured Paraglaciecola sp.]|uniref:hypothetical protein n=1 Tax=uncultured Paraglaciecola sp. TaxID=1765024 RepID=UPI0030D82587